MDRGAQGMEPQRLRVLSSEGHGIVLHLGNRGVACCAIELNCLAPECVCVSDAQMSVCV